MKVLIWVDPHKASVASAVVDEALSELLERASRRTATAPGCSRRSPGDGGRSEDDVVPRRPPLAPRVGPFTSADFIDDVVAAQDAIDRDKLERWLLSPRPGFRRPPSLNPKERSFRAPTAVASGRAWARSAPSVPLYESYSIGWPRPSSGLDPRRLTLDSSARRRMAGRLQKVLL